MSFHDDRPVGWVNPHNGMRYVRNVQFTCALDNYEPMPRTTGSSLLEEWQAKDGTLIYRLVGWQREKDAMRAVYLLDDGRSVRPYYVAGYSQERDRITLHQFPTNYRPDGTRKVRADNGQPVDHGTWMLGPRRAYHLKLEAEA